MHAGKERHGVGTDVLEHMSKDKLALEKCAEALALLQSHAANRLCACTHFCGCPVAGSRMLTLTVRIWMRTRG